MGVTLSKQTIGVLSGIAATIAVPAVAAGSAFKPAWKTTRAERFGFGAWADARKLESPIWCHAASVGEVGGMIPVLKALRSAYPQQAILATVTSRTGRDEVAKSKLADVCAVLPFDHPALLRIALGGMRPKMCIIAETELWPNLILMLDRKKIPLHIINARISDRSFSRYQMLDWFFGPVLQAVDRIQAQSVSDAERFVLLGADPRRVEVCGSTKYDLAPVVLSDAERAQLAAALGIDLTRPCFVAGSVRPGEEEIVLDAYTLACRDVPGLQMIFAPRHPERFEPMAQLLTARSIGFRRRSSAGTPPASAGTPPASAGTPPASAGAPAAPAATPAAENVLLLDTIGELRKMYCLASFAFVGGTLVNIGGHNPLEPAACSVPVIVGPYTANVRDAIDSMRTAGVHLEAQSAGEIARFIVRLAHEEDLRAGLGALSHRVWESNAGATARVMERVSQGLGLTAFPESEYNSRKSAP